MSKLEISKGAAFLYIESAAIMVGGYLFWLALSKITSVEIIGIYSSLLSFANILTIIIVIGVPLSVQRSLAKSFSEGRLEDCRVSITASFIIIGTAIATSSIFIIVFKDWIHYFFKMDEYLIGLLILVTSSTSIYTLLRSIVIASLKTKALSLTAVISTFFKFLVSVILIVSGAVALGVSAGIAIFPILSSIMLGWHVTRTLQSSNGHPSEILGKSIKIVLLAGIVNWIPGVINTVGSQLGTIIVNSSQGSAEAGIFFIAFSIVLALTTISTVLSSIAYPALSAMSDGRKRFAWRIIKINLIVTLPIASWAMFYSYDILLFFSNTYAKGAFTLQIMMLSIFPTVLSSIIGVLVYSYGNYKQFLFVGLAITVPRVLLYLLLIPSYGGLGAGIGYTSGSILGLLVSVIICKLIGMQLFWKDLALLFLIPTIIAFISEYSGLHFIIGMILTLLASYLLFIKFNILDRIDLQDILALMPNRTKNPALIRVLTMLACKLNRSF